MRNINNSIGLYLLTLCAIGFMSLIMTPAAHAQDLDLSALTSKASLGSGITEQQLPQIIKSNAVYCARIGGKNYLASVGAMTVFRKTVSSRTRSVSCSDKVKRQAMKEGIEVIQLSKSKMSEAAYKKLGKALTNAFGI